MSNYSLHSEEGLIKDAEPLDIISRFERIPTHITEDSAEGAQYVAQKIANIIRSKAANNENCVLALASGNSPVVIYRELLRMHQEEGLSFANCDIFTIFEYHPITIDAVQSYNSTLRNEFIEHIDIEKSRVHYIDGGHSTESISAYCRNYEALIKSRGGIDVLLLGIGLVGQIALNESGTYSTSRTRVVALSNASRKVVAQQFYGYENVPSRAITIGIGTMLTSKNIFYISWGEEKAELISRVIEQTPDISVPASLLQEHPNIEIVVDEGSASRLTRVKTPWLVGTCEWTPRFTRKAVLWLCQRVNKPILKLTYKDYIDNHLGQLVDASGDGFDKINIQIFNDLQRTISGWPGGKPGVDDSTRPAKNTPYPKRVVIFSPHPDDDVISMGGTFLRLVEQEHDVHVAYETSGNIAVHDDVVLQNLDTARECGLGDNYEKYREIIANKKNGEAEPYELRQLKGSIRRAEAKAACRSYGLNDSTNVHFLNLPFYETGSVKKGEVGQDDIDIVKEFLRTVKPHQIYAAGDLSDPHGTHRVCIEAVLGALYQIIDEGDEWIQECMMWLYRGAWQEWDLDMVDMAVPLSPDEVIKKRHAIYRHLSQKDIVPFPGDDKREFWQRAEDRTQNTARLYDKLGMAEYEAIEVFVRYNLL
ncbi:MAG: PIG-L family deacetylase [Rikenellaceae bacterium]